MRIESNFVMISKYNENISWLLSYTNNYIVYDRSDEWWEDSFMDKSKIVKVKNIGWDIYDKMTWIVDNYDNLPDCTILTKGNLFDYITPKEFDKLCNNKTYTPLLTQNHRIYMPTCYYEDGMYYEINNSWYLGAYPAKHFKDYNEFAVEMGLPTPEYLAFAPGSSYLVPKENILKRSKEFYQKIASYLDYSRQPGEAQIVERALNTIWQ